LLQVQVLGVSVVVLQVPQPLALVQARRQVGHQHPVRGRVAREEPAHAGLQVQQALLELRGTGTARRGEEW
jgi:hypothetical protein